MLPQKSSDRRDLPSAMGRTRGVIVGTDGLLYGTTVSGGDTNQGSVFQQTTTP